MTRPLLICVLCSWALAACAPTRPLSSEDARAELNRRLGDRRVRVVATDGAHDEALGFRIDADSVSWVDAAGRVQARALTDVLRVESVSRRRAVRKGARWGAVVGGAVGLAVGVWGWRYGDWLIDAMGGEVVGKAFWTAFAAGNYGVVGAGAGGLVGLVAADRDVYDVRELLEAEADE